MQINSIRKKYIGDKAFYKMVFAIVLPMVIQNTVNNFVNLLDNVMVGQMGTEQMSGVSIANQLIFVFNLCIFGGLSGAGIFTAQFFGAKDHEGVRYTFRFKVWTALIVLAGAYTVFSLFGENLIRLYLTEDSSGDLAATFNYSRDYLHIMYLGIAPFAISQCYASTLRETGETFVPMVSSVTEILLNLVLNYVLIFGKFGAPALGTNGAAIATVVSRYVGLTILIVYTHTHSHKHRFITGALRSLRIPADLVAHIIRKGMPLLANEALWSIGITAVTQQYSMRGMSVIAALNISQTLSNIFNVLYMSMGNAIGIIVGQALGANDSEGAKDIVRKMIVSSMLVSVVFAVILAICAPYLPLLYNTTEYVRTLATHFLWVCALIMPIYAFEHCTYFTLRSGGKTVITFIYDCGFTWIILFPAAHFIVTYTDLEISTVYLLCQGTDIFKAILGYVFVKKGIWIHNIIGAESPKKA